MKKLLILFVILLVISCEKKRQSEFVIKGLEKVYSNKNNTIDSLCRDKYELFYYYNKGNNKYYQKITLNKTSPDLWSGVVINNVNDTNQKEEKIYYKDGKYYNVDSNKERKDLENIRPYFQNDIFNNREFEIIHEVNDEFGPPDIPSLYAKYKDKKSFNSYFYKVIGKTIDSDDDITVYAKYENDNKEYPAFEGYFEVYFERNNEKLGESCYLNKY
jgi:lipoprotein